MNTILSHISVDADRSTSFFPAIFNDEFALSALTVLKKKKGKHKAVEILTNKTGAGR
jgi:hypothetical protein